MREIKFRAWDSSNKEMVTSENCVVGFDGRVRHLAASEASMSHLVLMQFTGLKDANGVEIYEGDLIQYGEHHGYLLRSFIAQVKYDADSAAFGYAYKKYKTFHAFAKHDELAFDVLNYTLVIGNVFENPELLEGSDATA